MLTSKNLFLLFCVLFTSNLFAQNLFFPLDTNAVTIDGQLQSSEWQYASAIKIGVSTTDSVLVQFKHDNTAMYFAFSGKLESANALFPEVLLDPQNAGGSSWINGQWWLHVSATDCENNGGYGVYNNCSAVQPGWTGAPNFASGMPYTDTVEIRVPFSKVGFDPATMNVMGMALLVTNTATIFKTYPATANKDVPATWADATFGKFNVGIPNTTAEKSIALYPNPATNEIHLSGLPASAMAYITDVSGRAVLQKELNNNDAGINIRNLHAGMYFICIANHAGKLFTGKFVVID